MTFRENRMKLLSLLSANWNWSVDDLSKASGFDPKDCFRYLRVKSEFRQGMNLCNAVALSLKSQWVTPYWLQQAKMLPPNEFTIAWLAYARSKDQEKRDGKDQAKRTDRR